MVKFKRIGRPTRKLVVELLMDIRRPDFKELCMGPVEPYTAVWQSIMESQYCYAVRDREDNLLAVFGLAAGQIEVNCIKATPIWFLGTNATYRHNRALVHFGKEFIARWMNEVGPMCNYIWIGNEPSLRYIRHMGARLMEAVPIGKNGEFFIPFVLE